MKTYIVNVDRYGCGGKDVYKNGDVLFADQLTPGRIAAGLKMGHLIAGDDREKPQPKAAATVADVVPAVDTLVEDPHDASGDTGSGDDAPEGFADEALDAAIDTLAGVDADALAALKTADLLCVGDAVEHLKEHGSFIGLAKGIGKGRDEQLKAALAKFLPADEQQPAAV